MTTIVKPLKQPCIDYESRFKHSDLERVKLSQSYDNGTTKTKKCLVFTGAEGIEGLLYAEERFRSAARQLDFTTGPELFDNFEEVLTDSAEEKWDTIVSNINAATREVDHFDNAIKEFYLKYCGAQAKDTMFQYLNLVRCPTKVQPRDHSNCIEMLVRYSNKLPGLSPDMNDDQ
eukprot:15353354-Ditylum_brightwellii.AAC.1